MLQVESGGATNGTLLMARGIGVDRPADREKEVTPKCEISQNIIKFGNVKHAAAARTLSFGLANTGRGELIVRAVECDGRFTTSLRPGMRIPAGGNRTVDVKLDAGELPYGIFTGHLLFITNDPVRPMRRLRVVAVIEE